MRDGPAKELLHDYLQNAREAMLWKLDGLSEYDMRRPLTQTGTNLLGLVKHLSVSESLYFGKVFDRPFPEPKPWWDDDGVDSADMWAGAAETRSAIVERYQRVWLHSDATIAALNLDAAGEVPWGGGTTVTLFQMVVHVLTETCRHAGHADVLREGLDGAVGVAVAFTNMREHDVQGWKNYRDHIESQAKEAAGLDG
jgi:uncharacterized damage-inducible protein DinB